MASLKSAGEIVAVIGGHANDAPSLKLAEIGYSLGISGTDIANSASGINNLNRSL